MFCIYFSIVLSTFQPMYRLIVMCELHAMLVDGPDKKLLMEDVVRLVVNNEDITMTGMLGNTKNVKGKIRSVDITKQEALIEKID